MSPILTRMIGAGSAGSGFGFGRRRGGASGPSFSATGGNQTPNTGLAPGNGYIYHTFTSPGTFTVSSGGNVEVLVVAGGGGGGGDVGGGGGAGGLAYNPSMTIGPGTYPVTVGPGGNGGPGTASPAGTLGIRSGGAGGDSIFNGITALGGGGGGGWDGSPGNTG